MTDPGDLSVDPAPLVTPPGTALDPMVALATSVHASPGVYALLVGSGVSSAAGIPTGWQVVADLVRKAAAAQAPDDPDAADVAGADPEAWWAEHGDGQALGYSVLLNALAPSQAARQALLAGYFEPSADDREQGRKVPTVAHHAIAQLAARGAVRVILTTNFDRLIERALEDVGAAPQVLHRPEQLASATPLAHARVTVIKLHGDYADLEQRNTIDELAEYPEVLAVYLGRLLDEYGLIISGWSADWDTALVHALEEVRARRYPLFWSSYGTVGESARRLIAQHGSVTLPGQTAEDLFTGIASRLDALDRLSDPPVAGDIAVQQLKRALPDPRRRIELFDLVDGETTRVISRITNTTRHPLGGMPFADQRTAYETETQTLARLLATGVFHGEETQDAFWLRILQRIMATRRQFTGSFNDATEAMRHYPALLCLWTMGVSAVLSKREQVLARLLLDATWTPFFSEPVPQPAVQCLNPSRILVIDDQGPPGLRWPYPQSRHLRAACRDVLSGVEPDDGRYKDACDRLEYLASLVAMDDNGNFPWVGEFILDGRYRQFGDKVEKELAPGWPLLAGGAFEGDADRAKAAQDKLHAWLAKNAQTW